ncbi:DNA/RNA non-specific endonuclease [Acidovorax sp. D4N7]|uniref:DNA/RNA non-specific endonuclease n=1 Tax=Comamonas endophytica TaxID=2949090 RepID=A0ABY6G8T1_9BURK|nr:DNA/RNA non-specific endonuclease [Acidovorax sp. 5MLIR]MCD2514017.1 DNA/RNA non-specific endonuclease [Acidovorax sp. D4N7]UYG51165.1 DNA/RNA non-specific endonuclease [Acidovorax sp. 5MLIR]
MNSGHTLARLTRRVALAATLIAAAAVSAKPSPAITALPANAFADCPGFFVAGHVPAPPLGVGKLRALCYDAFAVLHNGESKTPVYVAQRLNRALVDDADEKRTNKFFADARLPRSERAELDDYKRSGYSRGHMAPAGDMPTARAMAQSFSLANMVPQAIKHNSGPWARIEKDTRSYAHRAQGDVYVFTGPVFAPGSSTVGSGQVRVPTHLYKLVYDATTRRSWAYWQANDDAERVSKPISYEELVQRTGIQFLPQAIRTTSR